MNCRKILNKNLMEFKEAIDAVERMKLKCTYKKYDKLKINSICLDKVCNEIEQFNILCDYCESYGLFHCEVKSLEKDNYKRNHET